MQRLLKMVVFANVLSRSCQRESNLGTTASAWRKVFTPHARQFVSGRVTCIVNHGINSRFWNLFAWLILDEHGLLLAKLGSPSKRNSCETVTKQLRLAGFFNHFYNFEARHNTGSRSGNGPDDRCCDDANCFTTVSLAG